MSKRQIKLGAFIPTTSQHAAGWRHPESRPQDHLSIDYALNWQRPRKEVYLMLIFLQMVYR